MPAKVVYLASLRGVEQVCFQRFEGVASPLCQNGVALVNQLSS